MKIFRLVFLLCLLELTVNAQNTVNFKENSKAIVVTDGDVVTIKADTAYVLSYSSGQVVKQRRLELIRMRSINDSLETILTSNVEQLAELNSFIDSLKNQAVTDSITIAASFRASIDNLNQINNSLRAENSKLQKIQKEQKILILKQEDEINNLEKKTKGLWWNGMKDKVVAFGGGAVLGAFVVLLL